MPNHPRHHLLFLEPTDVLFFKDGRPMEGANAGHGAAWPNPHVFNAALHAALWRTKEDLGDLHRHRFARSGTVFSKDRDKHGHLFGSLQSAGPFPVGAPDAAPAPGESWWFPRPADAQDAKSAAPTLRPLAADALPAAASSLHPGLLPVVNTRPPSKESPEPWMSAAAWKAYLAGGGKTRKNDFLADEKIFGAEHTVGIGIDPDTGTTRHSAFYSASYLRLKEGWRLGLLAACLDKDGGDLVEKLFPNNGRRTTILVGGQQRTGTVARTAPSALPLPAGAQISGTRVKWTLLSPAIFPRIPANPAKNIPEHPGGWLPTWIDPESLQVMLKDPAQSRRTKGEGRKSWRKRVAALDPINARLAAALVPKPLVVTGFAQSDRDDQGEKQPGGARATHLAVPAGAVYYFEADDEESARRLADALNWHGGDGSLSAIRNRRSALMGEKGLGLGVCSEWKHF